MVEERVERLKRRLELLITQYPNIIDSDEQYKNYTIITQLAKEYRELTGDWYRRKI